ncbi:g7843 [Coccomyxa viridis]|uniref:DNA-directed RNA polymerase n=1 Tax=Coccomyxa viridis TaxID=1274662 RepID=A0ABP1FYW9_9CHLO
MERDVQIAHGNTRFLKQKFYDDSDHYIVNINRDTGLLAIGDPDNLTLRDSQRDVKKAALPYSAKLLTQELASMGIGVRYELG